MLNSSYKKPVDAIIFNVEIERTFLLEHVLVISSFAQFLNNNKESKLDLRQQEKK